MANEAGGREASRRLITGRTLTALAILAALEALLVAGAALGPWAALPLSELLDPSSLPAVLAGAAVLAAFLAAPLCASDLRADLDSGFPDGSAVAAPERNWLKRMIRFVRKKPAGTAGGRALGRASFLGAWQGAALGFFLLLAARGSALDGGQVLRCALLLAATAGLAALLAAATPRWYASLVLLWAVMLPLGAYLFAEIFLSTPAGAAGWRQAPEDQAGALRATLGWLLTLSPGTAILGALSGQLPDGTPFGWTRALPWLGGAILLGGGLIRQGNRPARNSPVPALRPAPPAS